MNDGEALLRAILDEPRDNLHRLVFADWLMENGQEDRAEFIRIQIELQGTPPLTPGLMEGIYSGRLSADDVRLLQDVHGATWNGNLRHREVHLLTAARAISWAGFSSPRPSAIYCISREYFDETKPLGRGFVILFSRGFLSAVKCTRFESWRKWGGEFVRVNPIERVEVSDRCPYEGTYKGGIDLWCWACGDGHHPAEAPVGFIPELKKQANPPFDDSKRLDRALFLTSTLAIDALSDVCIRLAKFQASRHSNRPIHTHVEPHVAKPAPQQDDVVGEDQRPVWIIE